MYQRGFHWMDFRGLIDIGGFYENLSRNSKLG
jgi:hypothetical protein